MLSILLGLTKAAILSRALYVAVAMQLPDRLQERSSSIHQLAKVTASDPVALERLMRFLILNDIFACDLQSGIYCNNDNSAQLTMDHPSGLRCLALHEDPKRWQALGHMQLSIQSGQANFATLNQGVGYFDYLRDNSLESSNFNNAMQLLSQQEVPAIVQKLQWSGDIIDLGGGSGYLARSLAPIDGVSSVKVLDLEQAVVDFPKLDSDKVTAVAGNFFQSLQEHRANTWVLKRILHDWDDVEASLILTNIKQAMQDGDKLYIIDAVLDQCKDEAFMAGIDLLLLTIFGGKERSYAQWHTLCDQVGLQITSIVGLTDMLHCIECRKK